MSEMVSIQINIKSDNDLTELYKSLQKFYNYNITYENNEISSKIGSNYGKDMGDIVKLIKQYKCIAKIITIPPCCGTDLDWEWLYIKNSAIDYYVSITATLLDFENIDSTPFTNTLEYLYNEEI